MLRKKLLPAIFILIVSLCVNKLNSAHIIGSVMYYNVVAINNINKTATVDVYMDMFRDANGGGAPFDLNAELGAFSTKNFQDFAYAKSALGSPGVIKEIIKSGISEECSSIVNITIEKTTYYFSFVLDINANYTFAYQRCCRSGNIVNLLQPGVDGTATTLSLTSTALSFVHNGPRPKSLFERVINVNEENNIDFGFVSANDLNFAFTQPLSAGRGDGKFEPEGSCYGVIPSPKKCLPPFSQSYFTLPYTFQQPFGPDVAMSLDSLSGNLKVSPNQIGVFNFAINVVEKKDNIILSQANLDWSTLTIKADTRFAKGLRYFDINENGEYDTNEKKSIVRFKSSEESCALIFNQINSNYIFVPKENKNYQIVSEDENFEIVNQPINFNFENTKNINQNIGYKVNRKKPKISVDASFSNTLCSGEIILHLKIKNISDTICEGSYMLYLPSYFEIEKSSLNFKKIKNYYSGVLIMEALTEKYFEMNIKVNKEFDAGKNFDINFVYKYTSSDTSNLQTVEMKRQYFIDCIDKGNKKTVSPNRNNKFEFNENDPLIYTFHFTQPSDIRYALTITDLLDKRFNLGTLNFIASSVDYEYTLVGNLLTIKFPNISKVEKGYIQFSIRPFYDMLQEGETIENTALFIWNQNDKITINKTVSTFVKNKKPILINLLYVAPNPVFDLFHIYGELSADEDIIKVEAISMSGQYIDLINTSEREWDASFLPSAMYILKVTTSKGNLFYLKMVKV